MHAAVRSSISGSARSPSSSASSPTCFGYWEREFRSIRPTKSAKGQRVYSRRDVENLMRVRELLYAEGFTIAGAKKKLQRNGVEPDAEQSEPEAIAQEAPGPVGRFRSARRLRA